MWTFTQALDFIGRTSHWHGRSVTLDGISIDVKYNEYNTDCVPFVKGKWENCYGKPSITTDPHPVAGRKRYAWQS